MKGEGAPTHILRSDGHVALIILRYACWSQNCCGKKITPPEVASQQLGWAAGLGGGGQVCPAAAITGFGSQADFWGWDGRKTIVWARVGGGGGLALGLGGWLF